MAEAQKIATTLASGNPDCKKVIDDLLDGLAIDTGDEEEDWEVKGKMIRYVIAKGALEQWTRLDKSVPNEDYYGRERTKRIIDALVSGGILLEVEQPLSNLQSKLVASKVLEIVTVNEKRFLCASSSIIRSLDPKPQDLETFVLSVLHSFNPMPIYSQNGERLARAEEDEFYRAATAILPSGMYIIRGENTTFGNVDFYVHTQDKKIKWCIDLVREGDSLDEHVQKFEKRDEGEQLSDKPSKKGADCDDYMILDFREAGKIAVDKEKAKSYAKVWFVKYIYSEAFTSISVSCFEPTTSKLRAIKTIKLPEQGHEQCSAFERIRREIILKCKDGTIPNLCAQLTAGTAEPDCNSCSNDKSAVSTTGVESHAQNFTQVQKLHNSTIEGCKWLEDGDINKVMGLIKIQFPHLTGLWDCLVGHTYRSFQKTDGAFIQIIHVNGNHWITVQNVPKLHIVKIYDSINESTSEDAKWQIAALLRTKDKQIELKIQNVQYQNECTDCGIFAVAFATDLAHGCNPSIRLYKQDLLRSHFLKCLSQKSMTPFPSKAKKFGPPKTEHIEVFCTMSCRLPANESMVQCIECKEQYHTSCIDINAILPSGWKCNVCAAPASLQAAWS